MFGARLGSQRHHVHASALWLSPLRQRLGIAVQWPPVFQQRTRKDEEREATGDPGVS
jgi:hypothetical protein